MFLEKSSCRLIFQKKDACDKQNAHIGFYYIRIFSSDDGRVLTETRRQLKSLFLTSLVFLASLKFKFPRNENVIHLLKEKYDAHLLKSFRCLEDKRRLQT